NNVIDTTAPTVSITSPAANATVSGTVAVTATAADNVGVVGVQFLLNGANLGAEVTSAPYSINWNTTSLANGTYKLSARARDAAGNTTTSAGVTVTVSNTAPSTIWSSTAAPTVAADSDSSAVEVGVKFRSDVAGYITGIRFYKGSTNTGTHVG